MTQKEAAPGRHNVRVILIAAAVVHCTLNVYVVMSVFLNRMMKMYVVYSRLPPEQRFVVNSLEDHQAITRILAVTPKDARILWLGPNPVIVNYFVYPRRLFWQREYSPDERIELDSEFLKSRKITHVFVNPSAIYPVVYGDRSPVGGSGTTESKD